MSIDTGSLVGKEQSQASFYLPFSFMITAFLALFVFTILIIVAGPLLDVATIRSPLGIGAMHLFILGFATMLAMGAVYQLVPVVINGTLFSNKLGIINYFMYTSGSVGLLIGFFQFNPIVLISSAILAVVGVIIFVVNISLTIAKAKAFNSILFATVSSFIYLLLTVFTGLLMGLNFSFGFLGTSHTSLLAAHIWFGLIGWFMFLIVGYSFKMLPMFYLAHGQSVKLQKWVLILFHVSLLLITMNFFLQLGFFVTIVGLITFFVALGLYRYHIYEIQQKKFKRNPGKGITLTVYVVNAFIFIVGLVIVALMIKPELFGSLSFLTAISVIYLFGWLGVTILGYLSKIVPFLWWTFRFGDRVGKENVPSLHDMIDERKIFYRLLFIYSSIILLAIGVALQISLLALVAQISLGVFIAYYLIHILSVFTYS